MEESINFKYQARYFTQGHKNAEHIVIALHGYGQLANYFLRKLEGLNPEKYFVVAPEGLHRFYTNGTSGRVGASWMTKESRETDIQNYLNYLNELFVQIRLDEYTTVTLVGFSQGGATASRFLGQQKFRIDKFISWSAIFPPDIEQNKFVGINQSKNYFVVGNKDEYYSEEDIVKEEARMIELGISMKFVRYSGNHSIDVKILQSILDEK